MICARLIHGDFNFASTEQVVVLADVPIADDGFPFNELLLKHGLGKHNVLVLFQLRGQEGLFEHLC